MVRAPGHPPVKLYAEDEGRGRVLVLLHGLGASGYSFRKIITPLARHFRVITIDLKGHGRSDKPFDTSYSARDQAVLIYWYLRQAGLDRVTLVGHSFGGQVALTLAVLLRHTDPARISRLVLMNAPVYPQKLTAAVELLRNPVLPYVVLSLVPPELATSIALMSQTFGGGRATDQDVAIYAQPYGDAGARHALIQTARQIVPEGAQRLMSSYPAVRQPALLIYCRKDQVVPLRTGARLAKALPDARLKVLESCDHVPMEQQPDAVYREIRRFMR